MLDKGECRMIDHSISSHFEPDLALPRRNNVSHLLFISIVFIRCGLPKSSTRGGTEQREDGGVTTRRNDRLKSTAKQELERKKMDGSDGWVKLGVEGVSQKSEREQGLALSNNERTMSEVSSRARPLERVL